MTLPRKPLRRVSKKRAALKRRTDPIEKAWLATFRWCPICQKMFRYSEQAYWGRVRLPTVHHMTRGANRARALGVLAALLPACGECNCGPLNDNAIWPLPRQMALKLTLDPENFSLDAINRLLAPRDAAIIPNAIEWKDIAPFLTFNR
jgi:hypothetical protein